MSGHLDSHAVWLLRRALDEARSAVARGEAGAERRMERLQRVVARAGDGPPEGDTRAALDALARGTAAGSVLLVGEEVRLRPVAAALDPLGLTPHYAGFPGAEAAWRRIAPFLTVITLEDTGGDGRDVLVDIAGPPLPPPLCLIIARALDPATRWECLALGATRCLTEPLDPTELAILTASYLRSRASPPPPLQRPERRILLAEDDAITARLVVHLLERKGFDVHHFSDGQAAMDAAEAIDADLVILDVNMPRLDGFTALAQLRSLHRYAHRPIVLFTSYDREEEKVRAFMLGANDYITKPFSGGEFLARVMRLLEPASAR